MDWTQIIVTAITICVPALVTLLTGKKLKKQANKHSARQSIMQLILEDKVRVMEGGLPENYQAILDEFDEYRENGGNSYISQKVDDYIVWYEDLKKTKKGGKNAKK